MMTDAGVAEGDGDASTPGQDPDWTLADAAASWGDSGLDGIDPEADRDGDGLTDIEEITRWGTSPVVADTDGDGFTDYEEVVKLAFDPEVNNFQFNPLIADRPQFELELARAPLIYATYETTAGTTESVGAERSEETRQANSRSWGGSNSYAVEQSHTVGATVGFDGWKMQGSVSYEFSYSTTQESSNEWSEEQATENAEILSEMQQFEESHEVSSSGGVLAVTARVKNPGDIAYFLENLTVAAYELDPENPGTASPIGTLTFLEGLKSFPRTRLEPGETSAPLTFATSLDLPTARALLENSRNLMLAPATWLLAGDGTVDFELAATAVNARTAEIIIDYGLQRAVEAYRISTVADERRNSVTVGDVFERVLRIPYEQGSAPFRRSPEGKPEPTRPSLLSVRTFGTSDEDAALWTVVHSYPVDSGANTRIDQYHPFTDELDFAALELKKGHVLQLIRISDADRDGLGERSEYAYGTDPNNPDSDGDGCKDGLEVAGWTVGEEDGAVRYRSDPLVKNTDFDLYDDCEEHRNGTDPMSSDNVRPEVAISLDTADGVRAVFTIDYSDKEGPVQKLRYVIDEGGPDEESGTIDFEESASSVQFERVFQRSGVHTVTVIAQDGQLSSEPATVEYVVAAPEAGLAQHWPIDADFDTSNGVLVNVAGELNAEAELVKFVAGREGAPKSAVDLSEGLLTVDPGAFPGEFSVSLWFRVLEEGSGNNVLVLGLSGSFAVSYDAGRLQLHALESNVVDDENVKVVWEGPEGWEDDDAVHLITVMVTTTSDDTKVAELYVNGERAGETEVQDASQSACFFILGPPEGGLSCGAGVPRNDLEPPLKAALDDLRIYDRALSPFEVLALFLD